MPSKTAEAPIIDSITIPQTVIPIETENLRKDFNKEQTVGETETVPLQKTDESEDYIDSEKLYTTQDIEGLVNAWNGGKFNGFEMYIEVAYGNQGRHIICVDIKTGKQIAICSIPDQSGDFSRVRRTFIAFIKKYGMPPSEQGIFRSTDIKDNNLQSDTDKEIRIDSRTNNSNLTPRRPIFNSYFKQ